MTEIRKALARFGPWIAGAVLLAIYLNLPEGGGGTVAEEADPAQSAEKLEVLSVRPLDPNPNSAVVIRYAGAGRVIGADFGKAAMEIIKK